MIGGIITAAAVVLSGGALLPAAPFMFGGISGGVTGGLTDGWRGALIGASLGVATGGAVFYGGPIVTTGLLLGGGAYSYATGGWSGLGDYASALAGGILGGYTGWNIGIGLGQSMQSGTLANEAGSARIGNRGLNRGLEDGDYTIQRRGSLPYDPERPGYPDNSPATKGYRYVGPKEADYALKHGKVPNVDLQGKDKAVFFTWDDPTNSGMAAKGNYGLEKVPTHRITVDLSKTKMNYGSGYTLNGNRLTEGTTYEEIPVLEVSPVDR